MPIGKITSLTENVQGFMYTATQQGAASTTVIILPDLVGYGNANDFFNWDFVAIVLLNVNSVSTAPEGEVRDITDFVASTGTFTCTAFSQNVEPGDIILVAKRELFIIDGVALKTTPITNSLAYRLSQYLASGDGDFAGGQPLPSNTSLVDIAGDFTGPHDGAEQDDNVKASLDLAHTDLDTIITDLSNATDGLGALKTLIDANQVDLDAIIAGTITNAAGADVATDVVAVQTDLDNATDGLGALKTLIDTVNTDLSNATDGLGALKALIDANQVDLDAIIAGTITNAAGADVATDVVAIQTDLDNATDGLGALKVLIDANQVDLDAIIAGTITNAAGADVATDVVAVKADTVAIIASSVMSQSQREFWSGLEDITLSTTQATVAAVRTVEIPAGTAGIPSGATLDCVHLLLRCRAIEDTSAAPNSVDNTAAIMTVQIDDVANTGWLASYAFADNSLLTKASAKEPGIDIESITDIKARADAADTYDIQFADAEVDGDNLILRDFQWGLKIWWH